jgi:hypothetical protein
LYQKHLGVQIDMHGGSEIANFRHGEAAAMANKDRRPESCREWWIIDRIRMSGRTVVGLADGERPRVFPAA